MIDDRGNRIAIQPLSAMTAMASAAATRVRPAAATEKRQRNSGTCVSTLDIKVVRQAPHARSMAS